MGYYTNYSVQLIPESEEVREAIEENDDLSYAIGDAPDSCKWYDHEADMQSFSQKFPDVVFKLKGEGEEGGDLWIKYFKNGKMQKCPAKIVYDDFDESKLR